MLKSMLLIALLATRLNATAIALIVTQRFIVVASDSKVVNTKLEFVRNTCKIRQTGTTYYIPVNYVRDAETGYDLDKIILSTKADSIADMADHVKAAAASPLRTALVNVLNKNPKAFKDDFGSGKAAGVAFAGIDNAVPTMVFLGFTIEGTTKTDLRIKGGEYSCPGDCREGHMGLFVPAQLQTLFERQHPRYWMGDPSEVADSAVSFVKLAIAQKLPDVGPPISVLVLDAAGARWLQLGACKPN